MMVMVITWGGAVGACDQPVEPGSDLPDKAPPANLGPQIDTGTLGDVSAAEGTDLTGTFDLEARVRNELIPEAIPFAFVADIDQMGAIESGEATLSLALRPPGGSDAPSTSTDGPVSVSEQGAFEATLSGYTVPASTSEMLQSDTDATIQLDAQVLDSRCFRGNAEITLRDVESPRGTIPELVLTGPFRASRRGASCDGGDLPSDAGGDVAGDG